MIEAFFFKWFGTMVVFFLAGLAWVHLLERRRGGESVVLLRWKFVVLMTVGAFALGWFEIWAHQDITPDQPAATAASLETTLSYAAGVTVIFLVLAGGMLLWATLKPPEEPEVLVKPLES